MRLYPGILDRGSSSPPGHGGALLKLTGAHPRAEGCGGAIHTTDTAPDFYRRHDYSMQKNVRAGNNAEVFIKVLI